MQVVGYMLSSARQWASYDNSQMISASADWLLRRLDATSYSNHISKTKKYPVEPDFLAAIFEDVSR